MMYCILHLMLGMPNLSVIESGGFNDFDVKHYSEQKIVLRCTSKTLRFFYKIHFVLKFTPPLLFVSRKKFSWGHLKPKWVKLCVTYPDANNVKLSTIVINRIPSTNQTSEILARPICNFYAAAVRVVLWAVI